MTTSISGSDTSTSPNDSQSVTRAATKTEIKSEARPTSGTKHVAPLAASSGTGTSAKESLREQKKAQARERILDCAQQLINSEGYAETKMRGVAAAASMSYQTLYNYFPTKGLILQELLTRDLVKLRRQSFETLTSDDPLVTKLREFAKGYIDAIAADKRHLWKEVCAELLKVTSHHSCFVALLDEQALNKCRDVLAGAQASGELDSHIDSDTLAGVLYSLLDATLMRYLVNQSITKAQILSAISDQIKITVTPYIR